MVGIFLPEIEMLAQRERIKAVANFGSEPEDAVEQLVKEFGYGRGDAEVIVNRFRIKTAALRALDKR